MTTIETKHTNGRQQITQRTTPCTCGCKGRDSWHAATVSRVVHNIAVLHEPRRTGMLQDLPKGVLAVGTYNHPDGMRPCELRAVLHRGEWRVWGWYRVGA